MAVGNWGRRSGNFVTPRIAESKASRVVRVRVPASAARPESIAELEGRVQRAMNAANEKTNFIPRPPSKNRDAGQ